ncbi:Hypothetical predicted protein [Olea europaea subsp. europaea]|uniref:Uncharacterized protein n=1 Tax=Olea europaea subsp. europaea TaxID=158383 RepID=A0A8S0UAG1_OLEEU|nr:Hypothetical predicted protein [Olea europaea subsp. europaea]
MYGKEEQKEEDKEERLLSYTIRESNDDFDPSLLSNEPPSNMEFYEYSQKPLGLESIRIELHSRMEFDENKYLEGAKQQQQKGDKAEDNCPELSSQRPPDFESIRVVPTSRMELDENKYLEATKYSCKKRTKPKITALNFQVRGLLT